MRTPQEVKDQSGNCYFLEQTEYNDILQKKNDKDFLLYPERSLSFRQVSTEWLPPPNTNVITENPWIVSSYDRRKVFILVNGEWQNPEDQTFGACTTIMIDRLFNIDASIPRLPITMLKNLLGVEHKR